MGWWTKTIIVGVFPALIAALAGAWVLATRGRRRPVQPGLPPESRDVNANPVPFGSQPPQGRPRK